MTSPVRFTFSFTMTLCLAGSLALPAHGLWGKNQKSSQVAGAVLFRDKGCAHCHGAAGIGSQKAPSLTGLPHDKKWTPAKLTDQILNGGQKMPPFADSLTDAQIAEIVDYLRAKHKPIPPGGTAAPPMSAAD